jgi:CheY-like chemotaxis protein
VRWKIFEVPLATILVVEDNPIFQRMIGHTLRKASHTVLVANNGLEALERLAETAIDLIVCDLSMPEMDGLTLLRHLRREPRYQALPFIMLTASGQDQDRVIASAEGANSFLTKPTSSSELVDTVRQILG